MGHWIRKWEVNCKCFCSGRHDSSATVSAHLCVLNSSILLGCWYVHQRPNCIPACVVRTTSTISVKAPPSGISCYSGIFPL